MTILGSTGGGLVKMERYDDRFAHNPPRVEAPAMDQEQFDYDNQREIEAHLLTNPVVMAHTLMSIKDRLTTVEAIIHGRYPVNS